jgi:DNA-binding NarL/FixJ family response regulator
MISKLVKRLILSIFLLTMLTNCSQGNGTQKKGKNGSKCLAIPKLLKKAKHTLNIDNNVKASIPLYNKVITLTRACKDCNQEFDVYYDLGNYYFMVSQFDNALRWYEKALENKKCANEYQNIAGINSNIGVIFLRKGYLKSAINHFISARKAMEEIGVKDQNYWVNYLNIGVAFMELDDLASAEIIFSKIDQKFSPTVSFLVHINLAKIAGIKNDERTFNKHIATAEFLVKALETYKTTLQELELEFYYQFKNIAKLKQLLINKAPAYNEEYVYTKLLLQEANLMVFKKLIGDQKTLVALKKEVLSVNDISSEIAFYDLMSKVELQNKNYKNYADAINMKMHLSDKKRLENTTTALKDYQVLTEKTSLKQENEQLRAQQNINILKIKNQRYLNFFLIISSLFLFVLGLYLYSYFQRKEKKKTNVIVEISKDLETSHEMQFSLQQKLRNQELRMEEILKTVGKIAILRKQIEAYFNNNKLKNTSPEDAAELKRAKLDVDLFFNNYTELAIIASQKEAYSFEKLRINNLFKDKLSDKELTVLSLIMNSYSSKEIGILLNKTEKAIEYTRKNIRVKLVIDSAIPIDVFVRDELKTHDV